MSASTAHQNDGTDAQPAVGLTEQRADNAIPIQSGMWNPPWLAAIREAGSRLAREHATRTSIGVIPPEASCLAARNTRVPCPVEPSGRLMPAMERRQGVIPVNDSTRDDKEVREGTEALQQIADDVEREREERGRSEFQAPAKPDEQLISDTAAVSEDNPDIDAVLRFPPTERGVS